MAIAKIVEGQTGLQVSNLLYDNDIQNDTVATRADANASLAKNAVFATGPYVSESASFTTGSISKTGVLNTTTPNYRATSVTANNMFKYEAGKDYYYSGSIDNAAYAGVIFQDASHAFLGYACGNVQTYNRFQLTNIPAGTFYIGACSVAVNPIIESRTTTNKIDGLQTDVDRLENDFYTTAPLSAAFAPGALRKTGLPEITATTYRRTSNANVNMFHVQPGKQHLYSGTIDNALYAGVCYYTSSFVFISYEAGDITTYNQFPLTIPAGAVYIGACALTTDPKIEIEVPVSDGGNVKIVYVDAAYAGATEAGTSTEPFKTLTAAIGGYNTGNITFLVRAGDYRENIPFANLGTGNFRFIGQETKRVRVLGSTKLTGWTNTAGNANVYQTPFAGALPAFPRFGGALVFEDGRPSMPIEARHVHPLQRNLSNRLPFSTLKPQTSIANVQANPGTYFLDAGILYIHPNGSGNPNTNGYSYEVNTRNINTATVAASQGSLINLELRNMQFMFGLRGVYMNGFSTVKRYNCTSLAMTGAGAFENSSGYVETWYEEAGFCNNDGDNSHFSASGFPFDTLTDNRSSYPTVVHHYLWTHDNGDDGESSHENHNVSLIGILAEFNGDSGSRPSNDATYYVRDCIFRNNGWEVTANGTNIAPNLGGEGFGAVNPSLSPSRAGCRAVIMNCVMEENNVGISAISQAANYVEAINVTTRNNNTEIYVSGGARIKTRNCLATNADPLKLKVVGAGGGTIEVANDPLLI